MKFVCISDTHEKHWDIEVPDGDVLIHSGDFTFQGDPKRVADFNRWLGTLPHRHKIVIAGNHDRSFQNYPEVVKPMLTNCIYLQDSMIELNGIRIYGSPWQPWFGGWAFNLKRGEEIAKKWKLIPDEVDILVTHGPAHGILDQVQIGGKFDGLAGEIDGGIVGHGPHVGCQDLLRRIQQINPRFHICGHIHSGYGEKTVLQTHYINASILNEEYEITNSPIVFHFDAAPGI